MCPGPTFDRVYVALKGQLTGGAFAPGEHLEPVAIGQELNASITPVRDALHRLVGERIVEAPRHDGFRVPAPTEAELRDLYGWNRELVELAIRRRAVARSRDVPAEPPVENMSLSDRAAHLFRRLARRAGSAELEAAIEGLSDRLAALRGVEARVFDDAMAEIDALCALLANEDMAALRRGINLYHRRRQRAVPDLLATARQRRDPP